MKITDKHMKALETMERASCKGPATTLICEMARMLLEDRAERETQTVARGYIGDPTEFNARLVKLEAAECPTIIEHRQVARLDQAVANLQNRTSNIEVAATKNANALAHLSGRVDGHAKNLVELSVRVDKAVDAKFGPMSYDLMKSLLGSLLAMVEEAEDA